MMLMKMAFRNIFRQKKRTFLTLSVMIFGIMLAVFYDGMIVSVSNDMFKIYVDTELGQYKIYGSGFYAEKEDNEQIEYLIDEEEIDKMLGEENYSPRLVFGGTLGNGDIEFPVKFIGVDKGLENSIFNREKDLIQGEFLKSDDQIVMGLSAANILGVQKGDYVTIVARTVNKSINAYDMEIGGVYKSLNNMMDKGTIFTTLNFAKEFLDTDKINDIVVMDKLSENKIQVLKRSADVVSWEEELDELIQLMKYKGNAAARSMLFVVVLAGVGIANTMLMSLYEREKEIGVMMANGMSDKNIMGMFICEGLFLGVVGSGIGTILGIIINLIVGKVGIPLPLKMYEDMGLDMVIPEKMYAVVNPGVSLQLFLIGVIISIIATLYVAYRSTKFNSAEILKN